MPEIKRVNYFTSLFLKEEDFKDEQSYHIDMQRRHNRSLHTWGVVEGLVVNNVAGQKSVTVSPGSAIDSKGREIVLPSDPAPQAIDLSAVTRGTDVLITIAYNEVEDPADKYTTAGVEGKFRRTTERPLLAAEASPLADGSVVILARVSVDAAGNIGAPNNAVRRLASAVVEPDLAVRSLKWGNNSRLQADQGGSIELGGDPNTAGGGTPYIDFHFLGKVQDFNARIINDGDGILSLQVPVFRTTGSVGIGTPTPGAKLTVQQGPTAVGAAANGKGLFVSAVMGPGTAADGGIEFRHDNLTQGIGFGFNTIYATGSNANQDLTIQSRGTGSVFLNPNQGNVGIGSGSPPKAKLQVSGGAIMPAVGNTAQAGIQFPSDPGLGSGDEAYIRYFAVSGETTKLLIGVGNDPDDTIGLFQAGSERMTIHNGNVGIGTPSPESKLHLKVPGSSTPIGAMTVDVDSFGTGPNSQASYFFRVRDIGAGPSTLFSIRGDGNVGIGTPTPGAKLTVQQGPTAAGATANGKGLFVSAGMGSGAEADGGIEFRHDNLTQGIGFGFNTIYATGSNSNQDLTIQSRGKGSVFLNPNQGNVGIGTNTPDAKLDVAGAIRAGNSDIYFTKTDHTHTGIGNAAGFAAIENASNPNFNCLMILGRSTGSPIVRRVQLWDFLQVNGDLVVTGRLTAPTKTGCVVDKFINKFSETLELGDVVTIGGNQSSLYYGLNDNIPIPEVDISQAAYNTRVCGIVCEVHGELASEPEQKKKAPGKDKKTKQPASSEKRSGAAKLQAREFTFQEMSAVDTTKVGPDQIGLMVTLGAFAHCKVDADIAPISVGDLLTTSPTKGHGQKVLDPSKATGAIIGKALGSLKKGKGKIPVLVTLH
jgi:hypothetical protein